MMSRISLMLFPPGDDDDSGFGWIQTILLIAVLCIETYDMWFQHETVLEPISSDLCISVCDGRVAKWSRGECECLRTPRR